jgi:hypothetical protein
MKKLVIIFTLALMLTLLAPPAKAVMQKQEVLLQQSQISIIDLMIENKINNRILELKQHVGKTRYVFSGTTPKGWDCSGLVMWFYSDFNIELLHSATVQMSEGKIVETPKPGDIVSLMYPGSKRVYHNGIYVGEGKMIHSPRPGRATEIRLISETHISHTVVYTRIIESGKID